MGPPFLQFLLVKLNLKNFTRIATKIWEKMGERCVHAGRDPVPFPEHFHEQAQPAVTGCIAEKPTRKVEFPLKNPQF